MIRSDWLNLEIEIEKMPQGPTQFIPYPDQSDVTNIRSLLVPIRHSQLCLMVTQLCMAHVLIMLV
jgi:hypothetical protein